MDLYDHIQLIPTLDFTDVGQAADRLLKDERVLQQLKYIVIDHLLYLIALEHASTKNASVFFDETGAEERLDMILEPVVKRLVKEKATLIPEYFTDSDDPRNRRIIEENIQRAIRENNKIERLS